MIPVGILSSYATTFGLEALYVTKNDLFSGVPKNITIGVESPDRHVIVAIADFSATVISTPHTLLINGEPALCDVWHYVNQVYVGWYRAAVPTGSTITVDVIGADRIAMQFYTLTGAGTPACVATAKTGTLSLDVVGIEEGPTLIADHNGNRGTSWENAVLDGTWQGTGTSTHALTVAHLETIGPVAVSTTTGTQYKCMASVTYAPWDGNPEYLPNSIWGVSGNSLGAVSDPISSWGTFAQADTAKQPVVAQDGSFKYAALDGSDYLPRSASHGLNTSQTMFAVVRVPTAATRSVVGVSSGTGVHLGFTATLQAKMAAHGGDFASANTTATASTGQWCVISGRYTYGSSLESRLNAGTISAVSTTTNATQDRSNALGGNAGSAHPAMDIAEAWNFRRALSNAEWDGIVSHLMTKYGIGA